MQDAVNPETLSKPACPAVHEQIAGKNQRSTGDFSVPKAAEIDLLFCLNLTSREDTQLRCEL